MPKRKITEITDHSVDTLARLIRDEYKAYELYKQEKEALKDVPPEELVHETAILFVRRLHLEVVSNNLDGAIEESQQSHEGDTPVDDENSPAFREASDSLAGMMDKGSFVFLHKKEIDNLEINIAKIYEVAGTDEPLPIDFLMVAAQPELDRETIEYYVGLYKEGKSLFEGGEELDSRLNLDEPEPEMEEEKQEEIEAGGQKTDEEPEKEEKLNEEQVENRREEVNNSINTFFKNWLDFAMDPVSALKELSVFGYKPFDALLIGGKKIEELYTEEAAIQDPEEREAKLNEALKKEISEGEKEITFVKPQVLTNGKVVAGDEVLLKESRENLQAMADNYQKYNILLDQQLKELTQLKEEFGKTQELPKANFDGNKKEGSKYYQNMTSSLDNCISLLQDMKSGKRTVSPGVIQGVYNQFKKDCDTYVENRKGRIFGPITADGKKRLSLGLNGAGKVDRMINEIDRYTDKITSKVIVDANGKTFNRLNTQEQTEYINKITEAGKVKLKSEAEAEHEVCMEQLKRINVLDYALRDYSVEKNGQYMEAAANVILNIHHNIVNHGGKATSYDVNRVRNFDISQKEMAENPVFRSLVDKEGAKKVAEKWTDIEKRTDALRESIKDEYQNLLSETKQYGEFTYKYGMSASEYVSGIGAREIRSDINQGHTPESKLQELAANPEELEKAYDRMTTVVTNKLLLENDTFGKEVLSALASNQLDKEKNPDGKTNSFNMTVGDEDVRAHLYRTIKQILVQSKVLEGKKLPKALEQLESGKLGENLVNGIREAYNNEMKKGRDLDISAEQLDLGLKIKEQGLTRTDAQQKAYTDAHSMQSTYIGAAREGKDSLEDAGKGYMDEKTGRVDQEKIQKIIKAVSGEYVFRNRDKFLTKESIDTFERSFYQNKEAKMGILTLAEKYTGKELKEMIQENRFAKELADAMKVNAEPISKEAREANPELATKKYNLIKAAGELSMPEGLKEVKEPAMEAPKAGGPVM